MRLFLKSSHKRKRPGADGSSGDGTGDAERVVLGAVLFKRNFEQARALDRISALLGVSGKSAARADSNANNIRMPLPAPHRL